MMSHDFLAQQLHDAAIMENLNRLRHYLVGRITKEAAKKEIEAFNDSFSLPDTDKLSSIIVNQMLFTPSKDSNLAFEFSAVLASYLLTTCSEAGWDEEYAVFHEIASSMYDSESDMCDLPSESQDRLLAFLRSSIYSLAEKDVGDELDAPLSAMGL